MRKWALAEFSSWPFQGRSEQGLHLWDLWDEFSKAWTYVQMLISYLWGLIGMYVFGHMRQCKSALHVCAFVHNCVWVCMCSDTCRCLCARDCKCIIVYMMRMSYYVCILYDCVCGCLFIHVPYPCVQWAFCIHWVSHLAPAPTGSFLAFKICRGLSPHAANFRGFYRSPSLWNSFLQEGHCVPSLPPFRRICRIFLFKHLL